MIWVDTKQEFLARCESLVVMRTSVEAYIDRLESFTGYCCRCERITEIAHRRPEPGGWSDLRENLVCGCGLNGRMRMIFQTILPVLHQRRTERPASNLVLLERLTPLYAALAERVLDLIGTEFLGADRQPGELVEYRNLIVRHEDLLDLSFRSESCDFVFHGDVLEHIPDHQKALKEIFRVLKQGGEMYFTCPFFNIEEHVIRAELNGGRLVHHSEPVFHGNPASDGGSLVFADYGWPLLDEMKQAGFRNCQVGLLYDAFQGIVSNANPYASGHMWPMMFRARK